jgi:hypothetical protein
VLAAVQPPTLKSRAELVLHQPSPCPPIAVIIYPEVGGKLAMPPAQPVPTHLDEADCKGVWLDLANELLADGPDELVRGT